MKSGKALDSAAKVAANTVRSIAVGITAGLAITFFADTVAYLGDINSRYPLLILLLPLGAYLTLRIYQKLGDSFRRTTISAIDTIHDLEENSRLSFLVDFKKTYAKALSTVSSLIGKFFPSFSEKDISSFLYSFFPFMYGVYPYTMMTEKQLIAMREVGIEIYKIPIRDFVYKTVIKLLGGEDNG